MRRFANGRHDEPRIFTSRDAGSAYRCTIPGLKIHRAWGIHFINSRITAESGKALITCDAEVTGLE